MAFRKLVVIPLFWGPKWSPKLHERCKSAHDPLATSSLENLVGQQPRFHRAAHQRGFASRAQARAAAIRSGGVGWLKRRA